MARHPLNLISASAIIVVMTVVVTWPQALHLGSQVATHNDPYFSMWRLGWVAHALHTSPLHLFDANIFYPEPRTLAYSDAMLLEGVVAAPFLWIGVPLVLVYNVLLLGGIAASGVAMFVLARRLTSSPGAAIVSAAVFTMAPYRVEHFMHLELQWTMWIPLAFWAIHRAFDAERPLRWGVLAGAFLALQTLSCVYYGIFLAMLMTVLVVLLAASDHRGARAALPGLMLGAIIAAVLVVPYLQPYRLNVSTLGLRPNAEVTQFSAAPVNYLLAPSQNWLLGGGVADSVGNEGRLYPGLAAFLLGVAALLYRPRRFVWIYAALLALAVELSFGLNGPVYGWLHTHVNALHGLRAPARFAILAQCALAALAGFGVCAVERQLRASRARVVLVASVMALLTMDYASSNPDLVTVADNRPDVYTVIRLTGPGVVADLPMPHSNSLPQWDAIYEAWSVNHWHPLVNGYSGFYPPGYFKTLELMETFPDKKSIARLRELKVRFIVLHRSLCEPADYISMLNRMRDRRELASGGVYSDPMGEAQLFELRPGQ